MFHVTIFKCSRDLVCLIMHELDPDMNWSYLNPIKSRLLFLRVYVMNYEKLIFTLMYVP
jgi:hypothetical protein